MAALCIGADHEGRHAHSIAMFIDLRRQYVIVPAAPIVIGDQECRTLPRSAAHQGLHQRLDELLSGSNTARRMLAGARRGNVSHSWQGSIFKVCKVLIQIDNMARQFRVVQKTSYVE